MISEVSITHQLKYYHHLHGIKHRHAHVNWVCIFQPCNTACRVLLKLWSIFKYGLWHRNEKGGRYCLIITILGINQVILLSVNTFYSPQILLTGCPVVTTPINFTTLGCLNWPLMAASWRNLTLSASQLPGLSVFTATSTGPLGEDHTPWETIPNWPEPKCLVMLKKWRWNVKKIACLVGHHNV